MNFAFPCGKMITPGKVFFVFLFFCSFGISAQPSGKAIMPEVFFKCWASSYEEDTDAVTRTKTYRPCDYKDFNMSMYRHKIEFYKSGKCKWLKLAANDAHYFVEGNWIYKRGNIIVRNVEKEVVLKFKIKHLAQNRMTIVVTEQN